ncbi:MAG: hypothetical protein ACYC26_10460 [Phycisphaerales bacterium]
MSDRLAKQQLDKTGKPARPDRDPAAQPAESSMPWVTDQALDTRLGLDASHGDAPAKKRVSQGVLLLLAALVVAGAALFIMRKTGQARVDTSANSVEKQIETALAQLTGKPAATSGGGGDALLVNTDQVIARFAEDPTARQIDLEHVRKNPFMLTVVTRSAANDAQAVPVVNVDDRVKQQQLQQLRAELDKLTLQTVMEGRTPLAVISNKVVRTGDQIGGFRVVSIEPRAVTLTADGNTYQLTMQSPNLGQQ